MANIPLIKYVTLPYDSNGHYDGSFDHRTGVLGLLKDKHTDRFLVKHEVVHAEDMIEGRFKEYRDIKSNPEIVAKILERKFKHTVLWKIRRSFDKNKRSYSEFKKAVKEARTKFMKKPLSKIFIGIEDNTVWKKHEIHPFASTTRLDSELIANAAVYGVIPIPETMKSVYVSQYSVKTGKEAEAAIVEKNYCDEHKKYLRPLSIRQFFRKEFQ